MADEPPETHLPDHSGGAFKGVPNPELGAERREARHVLRPSLPAETFGQGSGLEDVGSVSSDEAQASAGSID